MAGNEFNRDRHGDGLHCHEGDQHEQLHRPGHQRARPTQQHARRCAKTGPQGVRTGKYLRYDWEDVEAWWAEQKRQP